MDPPPTRPLMLFDGDCTFCKWWINRWQSQVGDQIDFAPYQESGESPGGVPREALSKAVHLVEPGGQIRRGAAAVFAARARAPGHKSGWWLYQHLPGFAWTAEHAYQLIANHRGAFFILTRLLWGRDPTPSTYLLARGLFLRLLGVVALIAIISLWSQIDGLIGSKGILPATDFLSLVHDHLGPQSYRELPTLCWFNTSDAFLNGLCLAGTLLAVMLILGIAPIPALVGYWAVYLSLSLVGQEFLSFQWDSLLLESCLAALFIAPAVWLVRSTRAAAPPAIGIFLARFLLFKLMFLSGVTKLLSGDTTWLDGTALNYHYFTQPIPTWTSWYAAQVPDWFQKMSLTVMFVIEVGVPFLIFAPRRLRHLAALFLIIFQLLIAGTGNYGFFNLLAIILCVPLLDDQFLSRRQWLGRLAQARTQQSQWLGRLAQARRLIEPSPRAGIREESTTIAQQGASAKPLQPAPAGAAACSHGWSESRHEPRGSDSRNPWEVFIRLAAAAVLFVSVLTLLREMVRTYHPTDKRTTTGWLLNTTDTLLLSWGQSAILQWTDPLRTISGYGLFRVMTTQRVEIEIQGTTDGREWKAYEFRWKPGDVKRAPSYVAPHQPRLDWQMWFAALSPQGHARMLENLANALLENRPQVLALLGTNPFPQKPPALVRFVYWRYEFTTFDERRETGAWWKRREVGRSKAIRGK